MALTAYRSKGTKHGLISHIHVNSNRQGAIRPTSPAAPADHLLIPECDWLDEGVGSRPAFSTHSPSLFFFFFCVLSFFPFFIERALMVSLLCTYCLSTLFDSFPSFPLFAGTRVRIRSRATEVFRALPNSSFPPPFLCACQRSPACVSSESNTNHPTSHEHSHLL